MPELPEIAARARQMNAELVGKKISGIEVLQSKCLNMSDTDFTLALNGATLKNTQYKGKWLLTETDNGWLLINLGMGGEILLVTRNEMPKKYRLVFDFADNSCLAINFWWFGYVHYSALEKLDQHPMISKLGVNALDLTVEQISTMIKGRRGNLKSFLLDQSHVAGIGNFYIHDILFLARLHPLRPLNSLNDGEVKALHDAIQNCLRSSLEKGGAFYELDLHGKGGEFLREDIIIGYLENQPCPQCKMPIVKIKTGGTSSYICPQCQSL